MDDSSSTQRSKELSSGLLALAWLLIISGALIALFVISELLSAYRQMENHSFVGEIIRKLQDSSLFTFADQSLAVSQQGATIIAYVLFILFALLAIHIATALIRSGTHILSPTFSYQFAKLKSRIDQLK